MYLLTLHARRVALLLLEEALLLDPEDKDGTLAALIADNPLFDSLTQTLRLQPSGTTALSPGGAAGLGVLRRSTQGGLSVSSSYGGRGMGVGGWSPTGGLDSKHGTIGASGALVSSGAFASSGGGGGGGGGCSGPYGEAARRKDLLGATLRLTHGMAATLPSGFAEARKAAAGAAARRSSMLNNSIVSSTGGGGTAGGGHSDAVSPSVGRGQGAVRASKNLLRRTLELGRTLSSSKLASAILQTQAHRTLNPKGSLGYSVSDRTAGLWGQHNNGYYTSDRNRLVAGVRAPGDPHTVHTFMASGDNTNVKDLGATMTSDGGNSSMMSTLKLAGEDWKLFNKCEFVA